MSRPKEHPTDAIVGRRNARGVYEQRKRGPSTWVYLGTWPTDDYTTPESPAFENGWDHAGDPYDRFAFRWGEHGRLELKGILSSEGAASETVAFTLPAEYWPATDDTRIVDVWDGTELQLSRITISATTGEATVVTPVATPGGPGGAGFAFDLRVPRSSSLQGNSFFSVIALTDYDAACWQFVKDVDGKIYGLIRVGAEAPTTPQVVLEISANATSGVTRLKVATKAVADGESMNPTLTDETAQDITVPGTAYQRKTVTFTLTETVAAGDLLLLEIFHEGTHANDTLNANTILWGAWLGSG